MGIGTFVGQPARRAAAAVPLRRAKPVNFDLPLLVVAIVLAIFGLMMLYSASASLFSSSAVYVNDFKQTPTYITLKQALILLASAGVAFVVSRLDYHIWRRYALWALLVSIAGLIVVLVKGVAILGSTRGILGGSVQPAELAKLALVIYLSVWLYSKREVLQNIQLGLIPLAIILGIVGGLIIRQPDISAAATVFVLGGLLFFLAGGDIRQFAIFMLAALLIGFLVVRFTQTGQVRIDHYTAGLRDPVLSDNQVLRTMEGAIRGGWFGVGLGKAGTKVTGLSLAFNDSIFAVILEELGLFGGLLTVGLYGLLLYRGLKIAAHAPDSLGSLMAAGLTFWIAIEALFNMTGMLGVLPVGGNVLPFISQGGSNMAVSVVAIGILLSISRQASANGPLAEEWRSYGASADLRRRNRRRRLSRARSL